MRKKFERQEPWIAESEVADFASRHPERTVRVGFYKERVIEEYIKIGNALEKGGYRYGPHFPLNSMEELANEALVVDLDQITIAMRIVNRGYTYEEREGEGTDDYALIATFVFEDAEDADRFTDIMIISGFYIVEDESLLD